MFVSSIATDRLTANAHASARQGHAPLKTRDFDLKTGWNLTDSFYTSQCVFLDNNGARKKKIVVCLPSSVASGYYAGSAHMQPHRFVSWILVLVGLALPAIAGAAPAAIDFEDVGGGAAVGTHFPGVTFTDGTMLCGVSLNCSSFRHSRSRVVSRRRQYHDPVRQPILGSRPISHSSGWCQAFNARTVLSAPPRQVSQQSRLVGEPGSSPNELLQLTSSSGISEVRIDADGGGAFTFDDVTVSRSADLTVFRPGSSVWYTLPSSSNFTGGTASAFGLNGDVPVPGDYDGDARSAWRCFDRRTHVVHPPVEHGDDRSIAFGLGTDTPVPAITMATADRSWGLCASTGTNHPTASSNFTASRPSSWAHSDIPLPRDYDGDHKR